MASQRANPGNRNNGSWLVAGIFVLGLAGVLAVYYWPSSNPPAAVITESAPLPVLSASPFLNTKMDVAYVGDQGCVDCHRSQCKSYHQHPMGRSLFTAADCPTLETYDEKNSGNTFLAGTLRFQAIRKEDKLIHREWCEDATGKLVAELKVEMDFAVGSGTQARSYLYRRDGFVFQSPITWYSRKSEFQLSPGYEKFQQHFSRQVDSRCLYCHCQEALPVENTVNRYREPIFGQLAIGCERCHGPGELHVASRKKGIEPVDVDYTIVNPRRLSPVLRDAVCEQCHLQGEAIVPRRGRSQMDYRPGLPLHEYVSVFVRPPAAGDSKLIVGHVEQMHQSACFSNSGGKFGCTSCHDPHKQPSPEEKFAFYKERCLNCHAEPPRKTTDEMSVKAPACAVPLRERLVKDAGDNCIKCHMQRSASSNATHLAVTDHRVLRIADRPRKSVPDRDDEMPLVAFHREWVGRNDEESRRDLGVAIVSLAVLGHGFGEEKIRDYLIRKALPLLDEAAARAPDDVPANESRGFALFALGRHDEALKVFDDVLAKAPDREQSLSWAVQPAEAMGRLELAENYSRRLTEKYPHFPDHRRQLAVVLAKRKAWPQALEEAERAVRSDPFRAETRALLVTVLLETGNRERAQTEFDIIGAIDPDYQKKIRPWFRERFGRAR